MPAMKTYEVIVSSAAVLDLEGISSYVAEQYRQESGHKYANRILGQLASLSYTADIFQYGRFASVKAIHAKAKTISIINHRWTVVFHTEDYYVMIDRIIPSKMVM